MANYKYSFFNDYSEGAHPLILEELQKTNLLQETGYGYDRYSLSAIKKIQNLLKSESNIYFVSGGTQANLICLSSVLKPYEAVICAQTGHIAVHEAGAIEATGHKIITIPSNDGKLTKEMILKVIEEHADEHMVKPKIVFISNSTEVGTHYLRNEIQELHDFCKTNDLYLYLDGARLASGLTAQGSDLELSDLSKLVDMFYIGGTKNGALLGEAIVINNDSLNNGFIRNVKQKGALLAKGRLLGIQFDILFKNNLYFELGKHANSMASRLTTELKSLNVKFLTESKSNQIFPILKNSVIEKLKLIYGFYVWSSIDSDSSSIRLVTSWATKEENIDIFIEDLKEIL